MKQANINGLSVGFIEKGEGEALILLHGGVSDSRYWEEEIDSFSKKFRVISWDAPGCGISDDPPNHFSLADYADTLDGLIDHLNIQHPHILGISFGGGLAIAYYERYPVKPQTLILVSAYAGWAGSLPQDEVSQRVQQARIQAKMDRDIVAESWLSSLFSSKATEEMKEKVKSVIKDFHPEGMLVMLEAFADADLRGVLPNISVPTLLLYGEEDVRSPIHVAQEIDQLIPDSELMIIPGTGHLVNLEVPNLFKTQVTDFIVKNSQTHPS